MAGHESLERRRFLIGTDTDVSGALSAVADKCLHDRGIDLVELHGPDDNPTLVVIETTSRRADELRQEFSDLIIEEDEELQF